MSTMMYTVAEVARELRLGRTRVYDLIRTRELPSVKIGGSRRVSSQALADFIDGLDRNGR